MKTVSHYYIEGIKEGRALLAMIPDMTLLEMQESYESCKRLALSHSDETKDMFRGERDFWKHQLKMRKN